jgi:TPR repeat protein
MAGRVTYLAIALGGVCGTLTALVGSPPAPDRGASQALPAKSSPPALVSAPSRAPDASRVTSPSQPNAAAAPSTSAPGTGAAVAAGSAAAPVNTASEGPPPPETKEALLRAEMHCDQKEAAACVLAARAYETGSAGPTDAEKAAKYRRIALTLWISQCDHNSALACFTLVEMYRSGRGVPQNERTADALLTRTRELCHYNEAPVCRELPPAP